jgi:cyclophilin family peptidyl-prolyl cis-trans isomerase
MRILWTLVLAVALILLAGCGGGEQAGQTEQAPGEEAPETAARQETQPPAADAGDTDNPILERSMNKDPGPADEVAVIKTNKGTIVVRFFPDVAPMAVANFKGLAAKGYYDGVTFHRVIGGFMMQGGDPTGTGRGGESLWGSSFKDEFSPKARFDRAGLLAMANRGPNTNGSQFFITYRDTPHLNDKHTIFGEVLEGMEVATAIAALPKGPGDKPTEPVVMESITLEEREL